ncbi:uncharacterized protein LOC114930355 [Nylanderia fulva]|uniref:uncharacterized protein LOC114930355 n=1 Tax=Nylanderia fulva TaxID=613905 RepID=UPI0010FB26DE|nr:uncharacterized protein LOC114930355 [Nylanderia fulva]
MGLKVAPQKTEAIFLHDVSHGAPPRAHISVEDTSIEVGACLKYLGLHLDSKWTFREHFRRISPKVEKTAMALQRLLPNLEGPGGSVRRLYAGTIHAMLLYGAPVWVKRLEATRGPRDATRQLQRRVANRICRGYSGGHHSNGQNPACSEGPLPTGADPEMEGQPQRSEAARTAHRRGYTTLSGKPWLDRVKGGVSFHTTQVLTGHGCFAIQKESIEYKDTDKCGTSQTKLKVTVTPADAYRRQNNNTDIHTSA